MFRLVAVRSRRAVHEQVFRELHRLDRLLLVAAVRAAAASHLERDHGDPQRDGREHGDDDRRDDRQVGLGLRQRVLHQNDRDARVLDARLYGDGDDACARLPGDAGEQAAAREADVRHEAAGEEDARRQQAEYVKVRVDAERHHEDDKEDEDRL